MKQVISVFVGILLFYSVIFLVDGSIASVMLSNPTVGLPMLAVSGASSILAFVLYYIFSKQ